MDSSTTAPMVEGSSSLDVSSPAVVGADAVVSSDTSTTLAGEAGRERLDAPLGASFVGVFRDTAGAGDGVLGWSITSSSVSEPT